MAGTSPAMTEKVDNAEYSDPCATGRRFSKRAAPIHGSSSTNVLPESPTNQARVDGPSFMSTSKPRLKRRKRWIGSATSRPRRRPMRAIPVSIKDTVRHQGSGDPRRPRGRMEDSAPAEVDAPVVARLRRAGFIVIGRTNMTEFAFSGIGINPHYGTPKKHMAAPYRARAGWIVLRRCGVGRRRHGVWRARHGHGRIVPDSGRL